MIPQSVYKRPPAYENVYQWHLGMVPKTIQVNEKTVDNPARNNAIFVVHGMGQQAWAETAALLRSGFEDVLEEIDDENPDAPIHPLSIPAPFIQEGFWANFDNLEKTFPEEVKHLEDSKIDFFVRMWKKRSISPTRTLRWFFSQQLKLVNPSVIWRIHLVAWLLYIPLQIVSFCMLTSLWLTKRNIIGSVLGDVRLYVSPRGVIERAIVQRIDKRVGSAFLRMIGLDWDFKRLKIKDRIKSNGKPVVFDRIIWVAHSLGSVVSYNVLSDLFHRANDIEKSDTSTDEQRKAVQKFRDSLRRFITIGSPLDKIAFLFQGGDNALRPWPQEDRVDLVKASYVGTGQKTRLRDFWINFYHVFDPVSGALQNPLICGKNPPLNFHIGMFKIPGLAHVSYWTDRYTLKYILSRLYGKEFLPVPADQNLKPITLTLLALLGYTVWSAIIAAILVLIFWGMWPALVSLTGKIWN